MGADSAMASLLHFANRNTPLPFYRGAGTLAEGIGSMDGMKEGGMRAVGTENSECTVVRVLGAQRHFSAVGIKQKV